MKASILDLRYKMKDILKALDRNEEVTILYHGSVKGVISNPRRSAASHITDHPFFNMLDETESVDAIMEQLRGNRYHAV